MKFYRFAALAGVPAVAAALTFGAGAASAGVRPDVTPPCGSSCNALFSEQSGPLYVQAETGGVYGSPVTDEHASNSAYSEDFNAAPVGTLRQFIRGGLISKTSYVALNYPHSYPVWENQYSPYGVDSGLCIAVKGSAHNGEGVTLRDCGAAARSLWVADVANEVADPNSTAGGSEDWPWVNASDKSFSRQLVLTYNGAGAQLTVAEIQQYAPGGTADYDEWGLETNPLP